MTQPDSTTNTGAVEALKPCPHCGNDGSGPIEDSLHVSHSQNDWHPAYDCYTVQCDKCSATMGYSASEEEAITAWNTRATPTPTSEAEVIERCAKVADEHAAQSWGLTEEESAALAIASGIRALVAAAFPAVKEEVSPAVDAALRSALVASSVVMDIPMPKYEFQKPDFGSGPASPTKEPRYD